MTDALLSLMLLALLGVAAFGFGRLVLKLLRVWEPTAERSVFAVAVGMGVIAYLVLGVGVLGGLNRLFFQAIVALAIVGSVGIGSAIREKRSPKERAARSPLALLCGAVLAALGVLTLIGALAPPSGSEWDALSYHLAAPKNYLRAGRIFYMPWDHHSSFPLTLQMLYLLMLGAGSVGGAKLCHWLCGALLVVSVYTFAVRRFAPAARGRSIGLLAALILAATPLVLWEMSVAYADLATALFTWLSLYALLNAAAPVSPLTPVPFPASVGPSPTLGRGVPVKGTARASREAGVRSNIGTPPPKVGEGPTEAGKGTGAWLLLSAVLMGFALGTKYTVLGFWGLLLLGVLININIGGVREKATRALIWGGVSLLVAAPWYVRAWLYTGNPVYPFFYNLFGGRYWSAENAALYAADQGAFGLGKGALAFLLGPWQATMEAGIAARMGRSFLFTEYVIFGLSPVYVALLLAVPLLGRRLSPTSGTLALFGAGVYVFWFFLMQQTRYLVPALPALALVCAEALLVLWEEQPLSRWLGAAVVAASAVWALFLSATLLAAPALPAVTGRIATSEYLARTLGGLAGASEFINRETPAGAKVALFDEVRGFYLDREYLWATPNHATLLPWDRYAGVDDWLADFRRRGYTTLLVNRGFAPRQDDGQRWRRLLPDAVAAGKVTLAFADRGVEVYRIVEEGGSR